MNEQTQRDNTEIENKRQESMAGDNFSPRDDEMQTTGSEEETSNTEAERYNTMGIAQATQNMSTQSIASFTRAIELDPQNPGYYYNRGIVYANDTSDLNSLRFALQDFTRALELRGDDADILNNRG